MTDQLNEAARAYYDSWLAARQRSPNRKRDLGKFNPANARLIAAAPELLAALRGLIDCLGPEGYFPAAGKTKTDAARAAIAKAEGTDD